MKPNHLTGVDAVLSGGSAAFAETLQLDWLPVAARAS
jgi:hypothetical protein